MSSISRRWPPWKAYSVSHQRQRSGHPVRRTKTQGRPIHDDSPWIEWKISVMRRESLIVRTARDYSMMKAQLAANRQPATGDRQQAMRNSAGGTLQLRNDRGQGYRTV